MSREKWAQQVHHIFYEKVCFWEQTKDIESVARSMPGLADDYAMAPHPATRSHRSQSRNHSRSHHSTRHESPDRESLMSHNTMRTVDSRRSHASKFDSLLSIWIHHFVENRRAEGPSPATIPLNELQVEVTRRFHLNWAERWARRILPKCRKGFFMLLFLLF